MFCNKCGEQLAPNASFCSCCGTKVEMVAPKAEQENLNPYAQLDAEEVHSNVQENVYSASAAQPPVGVMPQPAAPVCQPEVPVYPQPASPVVQPVYTQPPVAPAPPVYNAYPVNVQPAPQQPANPIANVFAYLSSGMMLLMAVLSLVPWFAVYNRYYTLFMATSSNNDDLAVGVIAFLLMLVCAALCIPGIILGIIKRERMSKGFPVACSVLSLISATIAFMGTSSSYITLTPVPIILFAVAVANIVFISLVKSR